MRGHSTFPPDSYGEVIPAGATQYEKLTYMVYRKMCTMIWAAWVFSPEEWPVGHTGEWEDGQVILGGDEGGRAIRHIFIKGVVHDIRTELNKMRGNRVYSVWLVGVVKWGPYVVVRYRSQ